MTDIPDNTEITEFVNQRYKYGFSTDIKSDTIQKGLNEGVIRLIAKKKKRTGIIIKFSFKSLS